MAELIRQLGDIILIPAELVQKYAKSGRSLEQQLGFCLDEVEKRFSETRGWTATHLYEPYDVFKFDVFVDFKLVTKRSLTIQASECSFGDQQPSYIFHIYALETDGEGACYIGQVKYSDLARHLKPSHDSSSSFCFLDEIQDLIQ